MNPSRGFPADAGGVTVASGWSDHQSSGSATAALAASGHGAPASTHALIVAISAGVSGSPSGGIFMSSTSPAMYFTSGLVAPRPGKMFGVPLSPPVSAMARTSRR